jgi:hypothetical protein
MPQIFPQNTFEKQTNGTIFYKEGNLQDFPHAGPGVFSSWRYNFDAGKQIFRAETTGKIFERRIVKDLHGNPKWTGWMEVPDAEAHGVQAIAINDRPLQLPNSDGAIKLQITPAIINSYTKEEINSIVDQKIISQASSAYVYVKWVIDPQTGAWATDPKRVLAITYPDGGLTETYYLVEPHPSTSGINEEATYWIFDEVIAQNPGGASNFFDWISIEVPNLRAFISYPVFTEHTTDYHFHLSGDFERQAWNSGLVFLDQLSGIVEIKDAAIHERTDVLSGELQAHIIDSGQEDSIHLTPEEREKWNLAYGSIKPIPNDGDRYVTLNGEYEYAYEQTEQGKLENKLVFEAQNLILKSGQSVVQSLLGEFNAITAGNNLITGIQLEIGLYNAKDVAIWFETVGSSDNLEKRSPDYTETSNPGHWLIGNKPFDRLVLLSADPNKTFSLTHVRLYCLYKPLTRVNIGDRDQKLPINLIGPPINPVTHEGEPMYNGEPLSQIIPDSSRTAEWGRISGYIDRQTDLNLYLSNFLNQKISHGPVDDIDDNGNPIPEAHLRFDVYRDSVIPSLIQQPGNKFSQEEISYNNITKPTKDKPIITGIRNELLALKAQSKIPYSATLSIEFVSCYQDTDENDLPVYFETNNTEIVSSPTVSSQPFDWNWPGGTFQDFDEIYIRNYDYKDTKYNGAEYLTNVKLIIRCIQYGDAVLESKNYQMTINGTNLFLNSSGNINVSGDSGLLDAYFRDVNTRILSGLTVNIGGNSSSIINGDHSSTIDGFVTSKIGKDLTAGISGSEFKQISGDLTEIIDHSKVTRAGWNTEEHIGANKYVTVYGDQIEVVKKNVKTDIGGSNTISISGDVKTDIEGSDTTYISVDVTTSISGQFDETIAGPASITIDGETSIVTPVLEISGETLDIVEKDLVSIDTERFEVTASASGIISTTDFAVLANTITIGSGIVEDDGTGNDIVVPKHYDTAGDEISVYGQEIDERYASRKIFETYAAKETEERISGDTWLFHELIATRTYIDEISGELDDEIVDRKEAIEEEAETRENRDDQLQAYIDGVSGDLDDNYYTKDEIIDGYYTRDETDDKFYNRDQIEANYYSKSETYDQTTIDDKIANSYKDVIDLEYESFDLVINDNDEFTRVIEDHTFANSERILFKKGDYEYTGTYTINFSRIKYVKGEEPVSVKSASTVIIPDSNNNTLFETIRIEIGDTVIESTGRIAKRFVIDSAEQVVALDKYHSLYQFLMREKSNIIFTGIETGREYTFYFDQPASGPYQFTFGNSLHNANEDFKNDGTIATNVEHLTVNTRTVVRAIGTDDPDKDALIIIEVIPNVNKTIEGAIPFILGNIKGQAYNSTNWYDAVDIITGVAPVVPGNSIAIEVEFKNDSWTHGPGESDYEIYFIKSDGTKKILTKGGEVIGKGAFSWTMPDLEADSEWVNTSHKKVIIDFIVQPDLYQVVIAADVLTAKVLDETTLEGFNQWYQPRYNEMRLFVNCTPEWFLNSIEDSEGNSSHKVFPWRYTVDKMPYFQNANEPREKKLVVTPIYWLVISEMGGHGYGSLTTYDAIEVLNTPAPEVIKNQLIVGQKNEVKFFPGKTFDELFTASSDYNYFKSLTDEERNAFLSEMYLTAWDSAITSHSTYDKVKQTFTFDIDSNAVGPIEFTIATPFRDIEIEDLNRYWKFSVKTTQAVKQLQIVHDVKGGGERLDEITQVPNEFFMTVGKDEEYNFHIDWGNDIPTFTHGTWTSSNSAIASFDSNNTTDKAILTVHKQGDTIIKFSSLYDYTKIATFRVHVHALPYKVEIVPQNRVYLTSEHIKNNLIWYYYNNTEITNPSQEIENIVGTWEEVQQPLLGAAVNFNNDNIHTGEMDIFPPDDLRIPENENYITTTIRFTTSSPTFDESDQSDKGGKLVAFSTIQIGRNSYSLEFERESDEENANIQVSNIIPKSTVEADNVVGVTLLMKTGLKLSNTTKALLETLFGTPIKWDSSTPIPIPVPKDGYVEYVDHESQYTFSFKMPYYDTKIILSTQAI